jgi:hypothetical protein
MSPFLFVGAGSLLLRRCLSDWPRTSWQSKATSKQGTCVAQGLADNRGSLTADAIRVCRAENWTPRSNNSALYTNFLRNFALHFPYYVITQTLLLPNFAASVGPGVA